MKSIVPELKAYVSSLDIDPAVDRIMLFGSHARGEAKFTSDVDIAILSESVLTSLQRGSLRCDFSDFDTRMKFDLFLLVGIS